MRTERNPKIYFRELPNRILYYANIIKDFEKEQQTELAGFYL